MEETCLDTSVLIELARRKLLRYIDPYEDRLYLTVLTLYEYLRGIKFLGRDIDRAKDLLERLFFIIEFDNKVIKKSSTVYFILHKKGIVIPDPDILIASSCIVHNIRIASFDKHFEKLTEVGLKLYDPRKVIDILNKRKK